MSTHSEHQKRARMASRNPLDDMYDQASSYAPVKSYHRPMSHDEEVAWYDKEREKIKQESQILVEESLDSTERSKKLLIDSEQIGVATAQQLVEQREKLEKTERNQDDIHRTTQQTQRNRNSLKSVFGGFFKNKFRCKPSYAPPMTAMTQSKSAAQHASTARNSHKSGLFKNKFSGKPCDAPPPTAMPQSKSAAQLASTANSAHIISDSSRAAIQGTGCEAMDNQIDINLDNISAGLRNVQRLYLSLLDQLFGFKPAAPGSKKS